MAIDFIAVISVVGFFMILKHIRSDKRREARISQRIIGNYRPTLSDKRLNDGGRTFVPNILGQPIEGTV